MVSKTSKGVADQIDEQILSKVYAALGEPHRLRLLRVLASGGEMSCGQLSQLVDMTASTASHHISELLDCGLIHMRKDGRFHLLSVRRDLLATYAPAVLSDARENA